MKSVERWWRLLIMSTIKWAYQNLTPMLVKLCKRITSAVEQKLCSCEQCFFKHALILLFFIRILTVIFFNKFILIMLQWPPLCPILLWCTSIGWMRKYLVSFMEAFVFVVYFIVNHLNLKLIAGWMWLIKYTCPNGLLTENVFLLTLTLILTLSLTLTLKHKNLFGMINWCHFSDILTALFGPENSSQGGGIGPQGGQTISRGHVPPCPLLPAPMFDGYLTFWQ